MKRTITLNELRRRFLEGCSFVLIDVRRRSDVDADPYMVPGATWRDPECVDAWGPTLSRDIEVVVYCVRGGRVSNGVVDRLRGLGFAARLIEGGIEAWKASGGATVPMAGKAEPHE